jgi:transcriptional regulator of acetoin/glycerol metabolism
MLAQAQPVMEFLFEQVARQRHSMVMLADPQGMLLHTLGDADFADRAARVALPRRHLERAVARHQCHRHRAGRRRAVEMHGAEHYLERNGFLTCAAAPILRPAGVLLGVLDISGDQRATTATPWAWCARPRA